ncbi:MAG: hypothetical protein HDQ96_15785 [Lachnospiraceae bacterium]|nr:hypothetical protein [Lachnospiraceae bacterium]
MKERLKLFKESLTETTTVSKREFLLTAAVCILGGIVLGILFSPRKYVMIGSQNGNNSANNNENGSRNGGGQDEEQIDE